jgi:hypothetical protein
MATLNNAKILDDINDAWDARDADASENDRRILTAADVLRATAAAKGLRLSFTAAESIVKRLVEESYYRAKIDKALDSRDFTELGRLRGSFFFRACNRLVLPVPFTVLQEANDSECSS